MKKRNLKNANNASLAREMYRDYIDHGAQTEADFLRLGYMRAQINAGKDAFAQLMRRERALSS